MADNKPKVQLTGNDGNAFAIMSICHNSARDAGWDKAHIQSVLKEMMSGDYDNLLATAMKHFEVS